MEIVLRDPVTAEEVAGTRPDAGGRFELSPVVEGTFDLVVVHAGEDVARDVVVPNAARGLRVRVPK